MEYQKSMLSLAIIASLSLSLMGCGESKQAENSTVPTSENQESNSQNKDLFLNGTPFKTDLINEYLVIKTALSKNNTEDAAKAAYQLAGNVKTITFSEISQDEKNEVGEILEVIQEHSEHIAKSEIDHQIEHFEAMSKDFQDLLAIVGSDRKLYLQYCPMYNENEGGMWLNDSEQIENPLFAGKMPTCGSVKEIIDQG